MSIASPYQLTYTYGPDHERRKSVLTQGASTLYTRLYLGEQENNTTIAGTQNIHYISGGNGLCAVVVRQNGVDNYYYVYTDHLGSILTLTNAAGVVAAEQNFDAWGRKRNPTTWHYSSIPIVPSWLYRGYTGHEELSEFKLINMNGRLYDPVAGRMLSVDNYVQSPNQTQSYNRYSYVHNNPLKYTDPSGENPAIIAGAIIGGVINGVRHIGQPQGFIKGFVIGAIAGAVAVATMGVGGSAIAGGGGFFATTSASIGTAVVSTAYSSAILGTGNMAAFGEPYSHDQWVKDIYIGAALGAAGGVFQYLVTPRVIPGGYVTVDPDELARNGFGGVIDDLGQPVSGSLAGKTAYSYGTGAATGGENLAFGLRRNLNEFSAATGFKNYRQFTSGGFKPAEIEAAIKNSSNSLHFNLTDFTKWRYSKYASNPIGPTLNNITNWELHTIYNTPGALQRTTFYRFINGSYQVVPKPF